MSQRPSTRPAPREAQGLTAWPMRLVPFEQLMLHLDRPDYPNHLAIRLRFRGQAQRELVEQALVQTIARHPLAAAVLDSERRAFVAAETPAGLQVHAEPDDWPGLWQRLARNRPEFVLESNATATCWTIASPHAWTDGLGGLQFVQDWLAAYVSLADPGAAQRLPRLSPERLEERGRIYGRRGFAFRTLPYQALGLWGAAKFAWRRPAPISLTTADTQQVNPLPPFPVLRHLRIPRTQLEGLRSQVGEGGAGQVAAILSALFNSIGRFWHTPVRRSPRDWIRLMVPLTTRTREDWRLPACNQATFVQMDRRVSQTTDLAELASGIARELGVIRRGALDRILLWALRGGAWVPGQIQRWGQPRPRRATSMATYLGRGFSRLDLPAIPGGYQVGDLQLHDVELLSPLLQGVPMSWAFLEFAGDLIVSLHVDPRVVTDVQAAQLLAAFPAALAELSRPAG